jgi:hypothetical protein
VPALRSRTRAHAATKLILIMAAATMLLGGAAQAQRTPTFYDLSDNPDRLELLDLSSIAGSGSSTTAVVVDLYREHASRGFRSTWQIDCSAARMAIVRIADFTPSQSGEPTNVKTQFISPSSSPRAGTLFNLACDGAGDLAASRTYFDDLPTIMRRFWR